MLRYGIIAIGVFLLIKLSDKSKVTWRDTIICMIAFSVINRVRDVYFRLI